ncbi:MAG: class I SAM-dependent methyltransferase [Candidatus Latescibacteria bacterium]|nr:class I SAM-dependent methyltransferase [Candidatus Latescibacterota bacterium]
MTLSDLIQRTPVPAPWAEGEKIPWHEPGFSQRMLREHLSQAHDAASRRTQTIEQQVAFIHTQLLGGAPGRVLDLGCGPGLYTSRLARLGHECVGIDFGPDSITYAREHAQGLDCTYVLEDLRRAEYGQGFDLAMLIFGEFNVFRPEEGRMILAKIFAALEPGGRLLLEVSPYDEVYRQGKRAATWHTTPAGLFSGEPHLYLHECFWDETQRVATDRYFVIDAATAAVTAYAASSQAYTSSQLQTLLGECGFVQVHHYPLQ